MLAYSKIFLAGGDNGELPTMFEWLLGLVEPHFNRFIEFVQNFYEEYQIVGMVLALVLIFVAVVVLVYFFRFIRFLLRMLKRFILRITGVERRRQEEAEKARMAGKARRASYNELLRWNQQTKSGEGESHWEEKVSLAAAEIRDSRGENQKAKEEKWQELVSGAAPYQGMLEEMEKELFALEEKIHEVIGKITALSKDELLAETAKLRVGIEFLKNDTENLRKLSTAFPDDLDVSALLELSDAFIHSTKNIEKGFITALVG